MTILNKTAMMLPLLTALGCGDNLMSDDPSDHKRDRDEDC
jgi:hypothetical protein